MDRSAAAREGCGLRGDRIEKAGTAVGGAGADFAARAVHAIGGIGDPVLRRATVEAVEALAWRAGPPERRRDDGGTASKPVGPDGDRRLVGDSIRFLTTFASIDDPERRLFALAVIDALATPAGDASAGRPDRRPGGAAPT